MLSIVIPTYNEAENLKEFIEALRNSLGDLNYEIIIVDDNSPDGTGELAELLKKEHDNINVIHRSGKMGSASAVIDGARVAVGDIIATLNADFQHPVEHLPMMIKQIGKCDLVIASRYVIGRNIKSWSWWRVVISRAATFFAYILIPKIRPIKDPLSGFFVLKKEVIKNSRIRPIGFKCLLEILVNSSYNEVVEVPYVFKTRRRGKSKVSFKDYFIYLHHVFRLTKNSKVEPMILHK